MARDCSGTAADSGALVVQVGNVADHIAGFL